jgi:DNA-binding transcriptional ArsR family regulator
MRDTISDVFAALGDPTRRYIYEQLLEDESGRTATELAFGATISRQAIVKHLQVLTRADLAATRRDGREVRYFVQRSGAAGASRWLSERSVAWDRRLAALEEKVRASPRRP